MNNVDSPIAEWEMNLKCLVISVGRRPQTNPIKIEIELSLKKSTMTIMGVVADNTSPFVTKFIIVWKRIIATASLKSPSPRIIENSFG